MQPASKPSPPSVRSPALSGASTPTARSSQHPPAAQVQAQGRPRGHSDPQSATDGALLGSPLSRVTSAPAVHVLPAPPSSPSLSVFGFDVSRLWDDDNDERPRSSFRHRSRSSFGSRSVSPLDKGRETPLSWWGSSGKHDSEVEPRPWRDAPRKKKSIPSEQTEGWDLTRQRVAEAAKSVLGTAGDVAHEALFLGVDLLEFAPVMGLATAARTLLNIWDAVQMVDMNRLACLRLTERCAEILLAVRAEVKEAGDTVDDELKAPIAKLVEAFTQVHIFLQKQVHRPFLKRYLKRDEILSQIQSCDQGLTEALSMFSLSIQIRILKQVQSAEVKRQADTQALLNSIINSRSVPPSASASQNTAPTNVLHLSGVEVEGLKLTGLPPSSSHKSLAAEPDASTSTSTLMQHNSPIPYARSPSQLSPSEVLPALRAVHAAQNSVDAARDMADLRGLMRAALQTSSDVEMLGVLQVGREEMPEAIKTLQRALERVNEKAGAESSGGESGVSGSGVRGEDQAPARKGTGESVESRGSSEGWGRDTLDREFLESGIDALRRMSKGVETTLPSWTITRYEVDRDKKIGIGFFSDVYKGTWRGRTVAIKVLAESTPAELFKREVAIWKGLRHPNVLGLCGASSASGDPPWFFVSLYMKNGSLVDYLRRVGMKDVGLGLDVQRGAGGLLTSRGRAGSHPLPGFRSGSPARGGSPGRRGNLGEIAEEVVSSRDTDLLRFMHEIAKGMEYLHRNGVLHGDLKAANVLVDDQIRCVISDFGQSEMKSEAYRISGTPPPHGTLRWQAPELMAGQGTLTSQMDIYSFAICCVEVLTMGRMPWPLMDDEAVRHFVLKENSRPTLPHTRFNTPALQELLRLCWHYDPAARPPFESIVKDLKAIRRGHGLNGEEVTSPPVPEVPDMWEDHYVRQSPDMKPGSLPSTPVMIPSPNRRDSSLGPGLAPGFVPGASPMSIADTGFFVTAREPSYSPPGPDAPSRFSRISHREETVGSRVHMPEPVFYTPSAPSSRASSLFTHTPSTQSEENLGAGMGTGVQVGYEGYDSPPPINERIAESRDERRYRMLLVHEFHPSLTLPLWEPGPIPLGAVGYLSKPRGAFVTLFNALTPEKSSGPARGLPSVHGYGRVDSGTQRQDKRNMAQRGFDTLAGLLTFRSKGDGPISKPVSRRYSFPLRAGHKTAYMCTETTMYRYMENLDAPKKWFKANVDTILKIYGDQHQIQKEDLYFVIGTLDSPDYALFVSHNHPDGQAHFNVYSSPKSGQPWGAFTTDTEVPPELGGPSYDEPIPGGLLSASKVSNNGGPWDTVLVARLRFKPDVADPTSL